MYSCKICGKQFSNHHKVAAHNHTHSPKWEEKRRVKKLKEDLEYSKPKKQFKKFIENKYTKWYIAIIDKSTKRSIKGYYESHHIIPRCIGGSDDLSNLARLTAREHFICHMLLPKMVEKSSPMFYRLLNAAIMMATESNQERYVNSRLYENIRKEYSIQQSIRMTGEGNTLYNTRWVSHLQNRICLKIKLDELDHYLSLGYVRKRINNFEEFQSKQEKILLKRIEKKLITQEKFLKLDLERRKRIEFLYKLYLEKKLSLREFAKTYYDKSHVSLFKNFKRYNLSIMAA